MSSPFLSIIIPTFNEETRIRPTLEKLRAYLDRQAYDYEVIVSDDGSVDGTVEVAQARMANWPNLSIIKSSVLNKGKGAAVKRGMLMAEGKYLLFTDADNAIPIEEIEKLLPFIEEYPIVYASRRDPGAKSFVAQPFLRALLSRVSNLIIQAIAVPGVRDTQCGFKLFEATVGKDIFSKIRRNRFGFDIEIFVIANHAGFNYRPVGVHTYNHFDSRVHTSLEAIRTFIDLICIKLNSIQGRYSEEVETVHDYSYLS